MRWLILADIHGNLPALEAVLLTPEARGCSRIVSLGDQINYGPQSREVLMRLQSLGALMLMGNHEERILRIHDGDLTGYNWRLLHWTHRQLRGLRVDFPMDVQEGRFFFTHGMPGDPYRHLKTTGELPPYLDALPEGVTHLFSGHSHMPWHAVHQERTAVNPGSAGFGKSQGGSRASFAVLDDSTGECTLHAAPYDVAALGRAFLRSGAVEDAPMMCRIVYETALTGREDSVTSLMHHIAATGKPLGLTLADEAAWQFADATFPWLDPISTPDFWKMTEEKLL